jgi:predicted nuclease of predicted toxin-antitoxin system
VDDILPPTAADTLIVTTAQDAERVILTQDLDFSAIIALSGKIKPSLISLRLSSTCIERVNVVLANLLPQVENKWATFQDEAGDAFSPFCRAHVLRVRSARQHKGVPLRDKLSNFVLRDAASNTAAFPSAWLRTGLDGLF